MMKIKIILVPVLALMLAACAKERTPEEKLESVQSKCTDMILSQSRALAKQGISGQYSLSSLPTVKERGTLKEIRSVPYATSTYLDNGQEGSAWRNCVEIESKR